MACWLLAMLCTEPLFSDDLPPAACAALALGALAHGDSNCYARSLAARLLASLASHSADAVASIAASGLPVLVRVLAAEYPENEKVHSVRLHRHAWTALRSVLALDANCEAFALHNGLAVVVQVRITTDMCHARPPSAHPPLTRASQALARTATAHVADPDHVALLRLLMVLRRLAAVDSLRLMLGAAGVVQAIVASPLRSMRGEEHWAYHRQVSAVLHSLVAEPALRVYMAGLGLREWLLDVVRCVQPCVV